MVRTTRPVSDLFLAFHIGPHAILTYGPSNLFRSSTRTPEQVFQLLESVFGALDGFAKRCRVYKVETVVRTIFGERWRKTSLREESHGFGSFLLP